MTEQELNQLKESGKDQREPGPEKEENANSDKNSDGDDPMTGGSQIPEIATDDGSVVETLDTAFHGTPGWSDGENVSGSNRADYYEARSYGKSDAEEELEEMRKRNKSGSDNKQQD